MSTDSTPSAMIARIGVPVSARSPSRSLSEEVVRVVEVDLATLLELPLRVTTFADGFTLVDRPVERPAFLLEVTFVPSNVVLVVLVLFAPPRPAAPARPPAPASAAAGARKDDAIGRTWSITFSTWSGLLSVDDGVAFGSRGSTSSALSSSRRMSTSVFL